MCERVIFHNEGVSPPQHEECARAHAAPLNVRAYSPDRIVRTTARADTLTAHTHTHFTTLQRSYQIFDEEGSLFIASALAAAQRDEEGEEQDHVGANAHNHPRLGLVVFPVCHVVFNLLGFIFRQACHVRKVFLIQLKAARLDGIA